MSERVLWATWGNGPWHALVNGSRITACADIAPAIHRTRSNPDFDEWCEVCWALASVRTKAAEALEAPGRRSAWSLAR